MERGKREEENRNRTRTVEKNNNVLIYEKAKLSKKNKLGTFQLNRYKTAK